MDTILMRIVNFTNLVEPQAIIRWSSQVHGPKTKVCQWLHEACIQCIQDTVLMRIVKFNEMNELQPMQGLIQFSWEL